MRRAVLLRSLALAALLGAPCVTAPAWAADQQPVVFGVVTGLSGEGAEYGRRNVDEMQIYADMVNARGGIDGRKLELAVGDSQDQADVLISLGKRFLAERHVTAFFGTGNSGETLAFEKAMKNTKVPIMMNYTWGNANTAPDFPAAFRIGPYNAYAATLLARYLEQAGDKNVVLLAEESAYGTDFADGLKTAIGDRLKVRVISYEPKILDLGPVLVKLAHESPQPDALVTAGNFQIIYNLQNQVPEAGLRSQIVGSWDYPTIKQYWDTAGKNGVGIIYGTFTAPNAQVTPTGAEFKKLFAAKFHRDPYFYEYFLWDCMNAVKTAVEQTHSVDHAKLIAALPNVAFEGTLEPEIHFLRDPSRGLYNQALAGTLYMKQFTAVGQTDADAKVVAEIKP